MTKCHNKNCDKHINKSKNKSLFCNKQCKKIFLEQEYYKSPKECKHCYKIISYNRKEYNFCNHSCSASYTNSHRKHSEETKSKLSILNKNNPKGCINNPKSKIKSIETNKLKWNFINPPKIFTCLNCGIQVSSKVNKKYCSRHCYLTSGNAGGYKPNSTKYTRCYYNSIKMDSKSEAKFAKILDSNNIEWVKNDSTFFTFKDNDNKLRKYYPDFYLPHLDLWVEIKGKYYIRTDDNLRRNSVKNIILIMSDELVDELAILRRIELLSKP